MNSRKKDIMNGGYVYGYIVRKSIYFIPDIYLIWHKYERTYLNIYITKTAYIYLNGFVFYILCRTQFIDCKNVYIFRAEQHRVEVKNSKYPTATPIKYFYFHTKMFENWVRKNAPLEKY